MDHRLSRPVGADNNRRGGHGRTLNPNHQTSVKGIAAAKEKPVAGPKGLSVRAGDGPPGALRYRPITGVVTSGADMELIAARGWRHQDKRERKPRLQDGPQSSRNTHSSPHRYFNPARNSTRSRSSCFVRCLMMSSGMADLPV